MLIIITLNDAHKKSQDRDKSSCLHGWTTFLFGI